MKTLRRTLFVLTLTLGAAACGNSITAPDDCEDPNTCEYTMGTGNYTLGTGNYTLGTGNYTLGTGNYTVGTGN